MSNQALVILLESILGKGQYTSKGNMSFVCPFHISNPPGKRKLEIQLNTNANNENPWHCWTCPPNNNSKGKTIRSLFKKLNVGSNKFEELELIIEPTYNHYTEVKKEEIITLPNEFISLNNITNLNKFDKIQAKHAINYIKNRGLNKDDIIKYNIGFCVEGRYIGRIIIPSYDISGNLNYFIARDYSETLTKKYDNPPISYKNIIGMELFINWNAPIILVEGIFDFLTIKRNCIPLFGKTIHRDGKLIKKIAESSVDKIYVALDKDAIKNSFDICEYLMSIGKETYLVELDGKDVNSMGFKPFLKTLENTQPLTLYSLLEKKLRYI